MVLGARATQVEYALLLGVAFAVPVALAVAGRSPLLLAPLAALPLAAPLLRTVRYFDEPRRLNPVLKGTARLALVHGLLFAAGLAAGGTG
ncbi:MAG: 1,4-dihydroxy-2-naphthoate octaprenyltransferase [Chloroflexi bacterium]|nr:1,4-dihydroxy-2-naphthoate octaprenyltransferase [Chloroflexota bacterium]